MQRSRIEPWMINSWLMKEGFTFKESSDIRYKAKELFTPLSYKESKEQAAPPESVEPPKQAETPKESQTPEEIGSLFDGDDASTEQPGLEAEFARQRAEQENSCVSCRKPLAENCPCSVRTVEDIPF